jgi:hypothetical protein
MLLHSLGECRGFILLSTGHPAYLNVYREVVQRFPALRTSINQHLLQAMSQIKSGKVFRGALWIVGEYSTEVSGAYSEVPIPPHFLLQQMFILQIFKLCSKSCAKS